VTVEKFELVGLSRELSSSVLALSISKTCIFAGENPFIWDISGARYPIPETSGDL